MYLVHRIEGSMRRNGIFDALSRRSPRIVLITLCIALVSSWLGAPLWLPRGLAVVVGAIAIVVMASRDRRNPISAADEIDATDKGGWIAQELAGSGSPSGSYVLGWCSVVAIALTGFQGAYTLPAWAALALVVAWAIANADYRREEE
jgi:hypothetical protein